MSNYFSPHPLVALDAKKEKGRNCLKKKWNSGKGLANFKFNIFYQ